jgi:DNA repair protein RadA/Sms
MGSQVNAQVVRGRPRSGVSRASAAPLSSGATSERTPTGFEGIDRVLGAGFVPGSVVLLAGEPGIGKSTLLLQLVASLSRAGRSCLIASGEESAEQVAERARRLGVDDVPLSFVTGRDLAGVIEAARDEHPFLLAVDSIQTVRDPDSTGIVGGPGQVRTCADALVGLAKSEGICVVLTGHVTKDGDLAGPRTLEHAVDVVLSFEGDPRSGHRMLSCGKNRFGQEGEVAWFEMGSAGLSEVDPGGWLSPGTGEAGTATALPMAGRRALAVEVQALVVPSENGARRQVTGLDLRRFQLVAAVVDRVAGVPVGRADLYGATAGGIKIDDPGCDLAMAAALASAATGRQAPGSSAFLGEVGLTGQVRPVPGMAQRLAAAQSRGIQTVYAPTDADPGTGVVGVRHLSDALSWAASRTAN